MARGNNQASGASGQANANANTFMGNANSLYSTVVPSLESEEMNPQGYNPADLEKMKTENMETTGGSEAGAVGQGGLLAARTRNAGAPAAAIASAARGAGQNLSRANLATDVGNEKLKEEQRQAGMGGLQSLTGLETGASNNALGEVANNVNANTNAANASWDWAKYLLDPAMQSAASGAGMAAGGGCWIAETIYGVDDDRTHLVRAWLNGPFRESAIGNLTMRLYIAIGQQVAWVARRSSLFRSILKPLFDKALQKAVGR